MAKPEWGTKRTCPQTGERFYDLGKDNPVTSPNGHQWYPEPVLKTKQPVVAVPEKKPVEESAESENESEELEDDIDLGDDDIELENDDDDDVLGDVSLDDDDADLSDVVQKPGDEDDS